MVRTRRSDAGPRWISALAESAAASRGRHRLRGSRCRRIGRDIRSGRTRWIGGPGGRPGRDPGVGPPRRVGAPCRPAADRAYRYGSLQSRRTAHHGGFRRPSRVRRAPTTAEPGVAALDCKRQGIQARAGDQQRAREVGRKLCHDTSSPRGGQTVGDRRTGRVAPDERSSQARRELGPGICAAGAARGRRARGRPARDRLEAAADRAARHRDRPARADGRRDQAQRQDPRDHARDVRCRVQGGRCQHRPGGDAVRDPAWPGRTGEADHGPAERPVARSGRGAAAHRSADPGQVGSRHRSSQQGGEPGHDPRGARDSSLPRRHARPGPRPRQRRVRCVDHL